MKLGNEKAQKKKKSKLSHTSEDMKDIISEDMKAINYKMK